MKPPFVAFFSHLSSQKSSDWPLFQSRAMQAPLPGEEGSAAPSHDMAVQESAATPDELSEEQDNELEATFEQRFEQFYLQLSEGKTGGMVVSGTDGTALLLVLSPIVGWPVLSRWGQCRRLWSSRENDSRRPPQITFLGICFVWKVSPQVTCGITAESFSLRPTRPPT